MKSSVEVFLKRNGLKDKKDARNKKDKHLSCLNVFLIKWESYHLNKTVRESLCDQHFFFKTDDEYFLQTWKQLCREMARESMCCQQFLKDCVSSENFNKSWRMLCREEVRETICVQKFVGSDKSLDNIEFIGLLSYFDEIIFCDWIHENGLCVVVPYNEGGKYSSNKNEERFCCCEFVS